MHRSQAIDHLARSDCSRLVATDRADRLETMLLAPCDDDPDWTGIDADVRREFENGQLDADPASERYDPVLMISLRSRYRASLNAFLESRLKALDFDVPSVEGAPIHPEAPLLRCKDDRERAEYEICPVCSWEDDGQDNANADVVMGGPNRGVSLTRARVNFLIEGIYAPSRLDLAGTRSHRRRTCVFGRSFVLDLERGRTRRGCRSAGTPRAHQCTPRRQASLQVARANLGYLRRRARPSRQRREPAREEERLRSPGPR